MDRVREIRRVRRRVRIGAPDLSLTPVSGMVAVTELVDRLSMINCWMRRSVRSRSAIGGSAAVRCWSGWRRRSWGGEDFLVELDRRRADSDDGGYGAWSPDLPGCVAVARDYDECVALMSEAIQLHLAGMREDDSPIPIPTAVGTLIVPAT